MPKLNAPLGGPVRAFLIDKEPERLYIPQLLFLYQTTRPYLRWIGIENHIVSIAPEIVPVAPTSIGFILVFTRLI